MKDVKLESVAQDIMYLTTNGQIKTSKHLQLAFTLKSLTDSKRVINLINRLDHCVTYTTTEEIETELIYFSKSSNSILPNKVTRF